MEDAAQAVFVVIPRLAFDLVVGLLGGRLLWLCGCADQADVTVQATVNALLHLPACDVLLLCHALGCVEVHSGKWQKDVVDRHKLSARAALLVVVPDFHKL